MEDAVMSAVAAPKAPKQRMTPPPFEKLQAEHLKELSKEDLSRYLTDSGVQPGSTKAAPQRTQISKFANNAIAAQPEIKRQVRELIAARDAANGVAHKKKRDDEERAQREKGSPCTSEDPGDKCVECSKKANKECVHHRCRGCCLAAMKREGYTCLPHIKDTDRRPAKNATEGGEKKAKADPNAHHGRAAYGPYIPAQPLTSIPWHSAVSAIAPPAAVHENLMMECPRCRASVCQLGVSPWAHIRECEGGCGRRAWTGHVGTQFMSVPAHEHRAARENSAATPAVVRAIRCARRRLALHEELWADVFGAREDAATPAGKTQAEQIPADRPSASAIVAALRAASSRIESLVGDEAAAAGRDAQMRAYAEEQRELFAERTGQINEAQTLEDLQQLQVKFFADGALAPSLYTDAVYVPPQFVSPSFFESQRPGGSSVAIL
eukprot:m51a1_g228 hypothetical protein (437) ;mRNA; r:95201-96904